MAGENRVLAGKAGAIDAVVAAMRAHVGNAGVLEQACWAMCNICNNGEFGVGWLCVSVRLVKLTDWCESNVIVARQGMRCSAIGVCAVWHQASALISLDLDCRSSCSVQCLFS